MPPRTITIIGSLNTDLVTHTPRVPTGGETLTATSFTTGPGGKGANQAVACARLSHPNPATSVPSDDDEAIAVKMIGSVGTDAFGPTLLASLEANRVDASGVRTVPGQSTGVAVILVETGSGENRILLNPGANHALQPRDFESRASLGAPLPDLLVLQLEIPLATVLQVLRTAREAGVAVLVNPAPAVALPAEAYADIAHLVVNESEAAILTGREVGEVEVEGFEWEGPVRELLGRGVRNVVVTLGARGAYWATAGGASGYVKAERVERVVDTTAAGDTFVGAYAVSIVWKGGHAAGEFLDEEVVKFACRAAARTVEKSGAQSAIPWANEVDRIGAGDG